MTINRERYYHFALVLCLVALASLLAYVVLLNRLNKDDESLIHTQDAHIARLRAFARKDAPTAPTPDAR